MRLAWLLSLLACGSESKLAPVETEAAEVGTGKLQGKVWTTDGEAVSGALVSVGARKTATNPLGFFTLEHLPVGRVVVQVEGDGFSSTGTVRSLREDEWSYVDLRVSPAEVLRWDPAEGGTLESSAGVELALGGLVDPLGEEVTGPVDVSVTLLNDAAAMAAAPGALMATRDGQDALLESLGMVEVRLTDEAGNPVQLAEAATISFPVAEGADTDGFTLFGYDPETGRWSEEGGGVVEDGRFEVEVAHFSWWNCDRFANTDQCVTGTLVAGGEPVAGATVSVSEEESLTWGSFETEADGRFTIDLPAGATVQLSLDYGEYSWESEVLELPQVVVDEDDRPGGCVDLGEVVVRSSDEDDDGFPSEARGGPDCDDDDPSINPGAVEVYYDGVDADCGGDDDFDQDGDGHTSDDYGGDDCKDTDFWTHPGRVDYCNGRDDDCSGDESDASDATTWYQDHDGDGYGTDTSETRACEAPGAAWVTEGGDCDDTETAPYQYYPGAPEDCGEAEDYNCDGSVATADADGDDFFACQDCDDADPLVYPGADETCDGKDNDCDGVSDDDPVDEKTYYLDYDADGFGDMTTAYTGCTVPDGYVEDTGAGADCDDEDAARYPGAEEICGDDVVQDCEGSEEEALDACPWSGEVDLADADARLIGEERFDYTGYSVSTAGDVDGDGRADLLVGSDLNDAGGTDAGAAYLVLGPVTGDLDLSDAEAKLIGEKANDRAGGSVSTAEDVDGDGHADLLVGAPENVAGGVDAGAAYLVLGPVTGTLDLSDADAKLIGEEVNDEAGSSVSTAGDVDGDGHADLLVGAYQNDADGIDAGAAYLVLGPGSGDLDLSEADAKLIGEGAGVLAGWAVANAGDVDGDGHADLVVGAPENVAGVSDTGAAYLVLGPVTGDLNLSEADAKLIGEEEGDDAGNSVSTAGDVDGDGRADLLVGAWLNEAGGPNAGAAYLVLAPASGDLDLSEADAKLIGEEPHDWAGISVSTAGDVDRDGRADLLVGAQNNDAGGTYAGAAYLVLGPVSGELDLSDATTRVVGEEGEDLAGISVSTAGDVNGDGRADLLVGAHENDAGGAEAGAAYLLLSPSF